MCFDICRKDILFVWFLPPPIIIYVNSIGVLHLGKCKTEVIQGNPTIRAGLHYVLTHEAAFCYMERGIFRDFLEKSSGLLAFITSSERAHRCAEYESEMAFNGT